MPPSDAGPGRRVAKWSGVPRLLLALAALFVLVLPFCLWSLHVGAISGTVGMVANLDAPRESWQVVPAAGVDVLIVWRAREGGKYPHSICVRTVLTHTTGQGEYSVDGWWLAPTWPIRRDGIAEVYVFKPGYSLLVDRRLLGQYRAHSHILGPPAVNPWTGLVLPDEDSLQPLKDRFCPDVERL